MNIQALQRKPKPGHGAAAFLSNRARVLRDGSQQEIEARLPRARPPPDTDLRDEGLLSRHPLPG